MGPPLLETWKRKPRLPLAMFGLIVASFLLPSKIVNADSLFHQYTTDITTSSIYIYNISGRCFSLNDKYNNHRQHKRRRRKDKKKFCSYNETAKKKENSLLFYSAEKEHKKKNEIKWRIAKSLAFLLFSNILLIMNILLLSVVVVVVGDDDDGGGCGEVKINALINNL